MENNLFKDAKSGDLFLMRCGHIYSFKNALYRNFLKTENGVIFDVKDNGVEYKDGEESALDIISKI